MTRKEERLLNKTLMLSLLLIESLDEMENLNSIYKQRLRNKGNSFKDELETYLKSVFDKTEGNSNVNNFAVEVSGRFDKILEEYE